MGKQGLNAPRPTVTVASDEDGLPDLGHALPNLDQVSPSQAWRDEQGWESLDHDLTQEQEEEDLVTSRGQASTCINRIEAGSENDPNFATNYDSGEEEVDSAAEIQSIPASTAEFQSTPAIVADIQIVPARVAEIQSGPEILADLSAVAAIQGNHATSQLPCHGWQ